MGALLDEDPLKAPPYVLRAEMNVILRALYATLGTVGGASGGAGAPDASTSGFLYAQDDGAGAVTFWVKSSNGTWVDVVMNR